MPKIIITKGKDISAKSGKEYEYYILKIGDIYEHRFFATSKLEKVYLDKVVSGLAHESFNEDDEEETEKAIDELFGK